jgi:hypothetical protein
MIYSHTVENRTIKESKFQHSATKRRGGQQH